MRIKFGSMPIDSQALQQLPAAAAAMEEIRAGLTPPLITSARWMLLTHRPLADDLERFVTTYTVNMAVDGLGIMSDDYLGHDADGTPEFDLRSLFEQVQSRATQVRWKARVEVVFQLKAGMLFDLNLRLPDELPGSWTAVADEAPQDQPIRTVEELQKAARIKRRLIVAGTFDKPEEMPTSEVRGRLGAITTALVDTPLEIETGWPVGISVTTYEWEE